MSTHPKRTRAEYNPPQLNVMSAIALTVAGLTTDGAHHKQWYLEQILEKLGANVVLIRKELHRKNGYSWDDGVAP